VSADPKLYFLIKCEGMMAVYLRETMWEIFRTTGYIKAYLLYRECEECSCTTVPLEHGKIPE